MDPTCGLADKFRDLLFDLFWEQLLYMIYYGQNIEQLNEQVEKLTLRGSSLKHQIDEAINNADKIEEEVLHWFNKVDDISERVQELQKESQAKRGCSMTSCPNPWLRYKLSKRAKEMAQEAHDIWGRGNFPRVSYRVPPPQLMSGSTNRESIEGIDSRVPIMNQLMEALRNPSVIVIGLCGLGGIGKTTIARELEKKQKNEKTFEKVIMATVSNELNIEKIQSQIAEKLGMQLKERTVDVRAARLCGRLKQENNMLLILDDLWEEIDLCKVGIPFIDDGNHNKKNEGCKVLLTSRDEALLLNRMKCQQIFKVGVLSENEALELFVRISELSTDSSSGELINIATAIVQKCGGLPLAIVTAAKALRREKDLYKWKYALQNLKNPLTRNVTGIKEVDAILTFSYDHLSSLEYKHIFLLAAMLSHDPSVEDLLMYSVGLNILEHVGNLEDAQIRIHAIISKLKSSNLFIDSFSSHHVTIHDVFRDFALSIASHEFHAFIHRKLQEWPDENIPQGCKTVCLQESDIIELPEEFHVPNLEFFLLSGTNRNLKIPNMLFKSSKELKVLAFAKVKLSSLPSLIFLQKLKALCLHSCLLEDITEIRRLKRLKVLSLAHSEIKRLPIELAELTSLQMLNLSHCSILKVIPQTLLSSLKKLEVLYMGNSFHQWRVEGSSEYEENASLYELKDLPISSLDVDIPSVSMLPETLFSDMKLNRFRIFIGCIGEWGDNYGTSNILKLKLQGSVHLTSDVLKLLELEVEDLYLYGPDELRHVLHSHDGRRFRHLRNLHIVSEAITNNVSNIILESLFSNKVLLPQLQTLKLSNLNHLIPLIWDGQLSHNSFSKLKTLIVKRCGFVRLVPLHVLKSLNNLEELEVVDCKMLEMVFDFEDLNDCIEMESSPMVVPLKKLELLCLPKLKNVWSNNYQEKVSFPNLKRVNVFECESLTSIFPASMAKGMLCDLEVLIIDKCGIDVIVAMDQVSSSDAGAVAFEFSRLTYLILSYLPNLRSFYPQRHALGCPHLEELRIQNCYELEIFEKQVSRSSSEIFEEENSQKYPLVAHGKVMCNLEKLILRGEQVIELIGRAQFLMYYFPKVKLLYLSLSWLPNSYVRKSPTNLGKLRLSGNLDDEAFGGHNNVAALASRFSKLTVVDISFSEAIMSSLLLVSSSNLTRLKVSCCKGLTTLMTSSVARCLVHLTDLLVEYCSEMKEIVTMQEGEGDDNKEIIFIKLQFLRLEHLEKLKCFCAHNYTFKFLLLEQIIIRECPRFKSFSPGLIKTPCLKSVQLGKHWETSHEIWDTDLHETFYQQRFETSREMVLDEDDAAAMIRNDRFPAHSFPQMEVLQIKGFAEDYCVTFPYKLLETFPKIKELHVEDSSFEDILFPSSHTSFHNLTFLKVSRCHQLAYLMTNSTAKSLVNLETLEIHDCDKLEEIIVRDETKEDDEEGGITLLSGLRELTSVSLPRLKTNFNVEVGAENTTGCTNIFNHNKVSLLKLEALKLFDLSNNLMSLIWEDQLLYDSFSNLRTLIVNNCNFMKSVPLCVLKSLHNLEELKVKWCVNLEMVFGYEDLNDYHKEMESSSSSVVVAQLNLARLEVAYCHRLTTLMTSSAASSLINLTHLSIQSCHQIEEIIIKQEGESDENNKEFDFNKLKFLKLDRLPRLKRFCGYNYSWRFSLLECVTITDCPRLTIFCPGDIYAPLLQNIRVTYYPPHKDIWMLDLNNTIQHLFTFEKVISEIGTMVLNAKNMTMMIKNVFPKVMVLYVERFEDEGATFPYTSLQIFPELMILYVEHGSFVEIFPSHDQIIGFMGKIPQFSRLDIANLNKLKSIWRDDPQSSPIHQNLKDLKVKSCCKLVKLAPSSASFQHLWKLSVSECHELIHLVTTLTAKSLVSLRWLEINDCKKMEEIVMNENNEDVQEGGVITFNKLESINITDMPSLKMFSSECHTFEFPKLGKVAIRGCPQMKKFCPGELKTPKLSQVKIEKNNIEWKDEGNLDKTMQDLSLGKV